jgi:hypothetical protein
MATRGASAGKGNVRTVGRQGADTDIAAPGGEHGGEPAKQAPATQGPAGAKLAVCRLAARADGWLRVAPDGEHKTCYLKWKFTSGPYSGKYVMVVCGWFDLVWGMEVLEEKVERVYAGSLNPVQDRFYQQD